MKLIKSLLARIFISIALNVLNPVITLIVSKIRTGKWFSLFSSPFFITTTLLLIVLLVISLFYRRAVVIKSRNSGPFAAFVANPQYGWRKIAKIDYRDVKWIVEEPIYSVRHQTDIESIEVNSIARCPKCDTELEEKVNFFGRYVWTCVLCNFKKSNKESMFKDAERATRIAKTKLRQQDKSENFN